MKAMAMVPTYNEAPNIEQLLREILRQGPEIGAVVVDDDSPDGTAAIVERLRQEDPRVHLLLRKEERGRGTAGIAGFRYAVVQDIPFIIEMDADFSHQPSYIPYFLGQMEDCDLLIGSRLVEGGGERGRHFLRKVITRLANFYILVILGLPFRDCTSGYRVFRREVLQAIELDQNHVRGPIGGRRGSVQSLPAGVPDQRSPVYPGRTHGRRVNLQPQDHAQCAEDDGQHPLEIS